MRNALYLDNRIRMRISAADVPSCNESVIELG